MNRHNALHQKMSKLDRSQHVYLHVHVHMWLVAIVCTHDHFRTPPLGLCGKPHCLSSAMPLGMQLNIFVYQIYISIR